MAATGGRNRKGRRCYLVKRFYEVYGNNVLGALKLEMSLLGIGTVLRLERNVWSMVK